MSFEQMKLEDLAAPIRNAMVGGPFGSNLVSRDYVDSGVPVIRGQNMGERWVGGDFVFVSAAKADTLSQNTARPGDLVFTQRGTLGQVSMVPQGRYDKYVVSQSQMKITPDPSKADVGFLYYLFISPGQLEYIRNASIQTGVPHTNLGILRKTPVAVPPLKDQQQIAATLGALDDRITLLRETNATLETIAQALFKSWFVDFDPVRAKMEGRAPEGMDEATAALFPDGLEKTRRGPIPKGWREASIYDVAQVIYGAPFASSKFNSEGMGRPLIRIRDLRDESPGVYTPEVHAKGYIVQAGDIVVGMDGEFRSYLWGGEDAWLNQRVCVFAPKAGVPASFLRSTIKPQLAHIEATETATTVIHLGKSDIDRFGALVPTPDVFSAFARVVEPLYARTVLNKQTARTLASLRDTLLPRLISGQLRLPQAEQLLEEAAP